MADRTSCRGHVPFELIVGLLIVVGIGMVVVSVIHQSSQPANGPADVVWDKEACAWCRMHLSDPSFAAQLHTADGQVLFFDDPGCLFAYQEKNDVRVHALYFHDVQSDEWLSEKQVAFIRVDDSPMGHNIAATRSGAADSMSLEQARQTVLAEMKHPSAKSADSDHRHGETAHAGH
ncbi:MAG: nitrous oxide reductase accessory protein NosL [Deltaproteobacteria bacterium]|nr:nitrous oxide reductase accessory protein NosL [Deltaproteobacteria bacterium]